MFFAKYHKSGSPKAGAGGGVGDNFPDNLQSSDVPFGGRDN